VMSATPRSLLPGCRRLDFKFLLFTLLTMPP
jgi:hypothetical protein